MRLYLDICCLKRPFDDQTQPRIRMESEAENLVELGFGTFDALHLASAEFATASAFLTVDDRLIATARRFSSALKVFTREPVGFLSEVVS